MRERLIGGALYAATPRLDWASLLGRSFEVDVLECPKCHGRLRVLAVITEREPVQRVLAHLGVPTEAPPLARARDPADDLDATEAPGQGQLTLGLAETRLTDSSTHWIAAEAGAGCLGRGQIGRQFSGLAA